MWQRLPNRQSAINQAKDEEHQQIVETEAAIALAHANHRPVGALEQRLAQQRQGAAVLGFGERIAGDHRGHSQFNLTDIKPACR